MRVYLSHSIRGPKGADATNTDMKANCGRVIQVGKYIRQVITSYIELYIPAESEDFVGRAYVKNYLTEEQILDIDCMIIDSCDAVIVFAPPDDSELQGGRLVEYNYAMKHHKPVYVFSSVSEAVIWIADLIMKG